MDDKIRKCCPNCCQLYQIKHHTSGLKENLPLFLSCGHTICENCIKSLTKFQEPIECKVCLCLMDIKAADVLALAQDKDNLHKMFPVNTHILGELYLQLMNRHESSQNTLEDCFIDIQAIINQQETAKDKCVECQSLTSKMCQQCDTTLCEYCFNKSHKNFVIFKNHALQKIATTPETNNNCKTHTDKQLDYYCKDCSKSVCMDCLFVGTDKSCKEHNLTSTSDINDSHMEQILNILPKVDETFRRLSKTAVDIGQLLYNIECDNGPKSEATKIIAEIEHHFSKLCSIVQKHKRETIDIVTKVKYAEKESLIKAKTDIHNALKKTKQIMKMISSTADTTMFKQMNLSVLLEDALKVVETPWYLLKEEDKDNPLKVTVNDNLNNLLRDYIQLEGSATSLYKLVPRAELAAEVEIPPPPPVPVMPPNLPRDVRHSKKTKQPPAPVKPKEENPRPLTFFKQAPNYRSKSASVNSLNSCSSDSSKRSFNPNEGYHSVSHVRPYVESHESKELYEGSQELIYMSHIVDPHNFYVQRASDQSLVKELLKEFRNAVSLPKPLMCHVAEGKIYLAYNKADNIWQRSRVVNIDNKDPNYPKFLVYCFDFGSLETVSINNLRLLPPTRWSTPPPLAFKCSIANCEPFNETWMSDDSILIQNIIDNKQAVIYVRRIVVTPNCDVKYECDVTTFEDKVSLAHALVFHHRAKMPNPKLKYSFVNSIREKPKIFTSNNDLKPHSIDEIYITLVLSPDKFFVRKLNHQQDYLRLSEELNQEYSLSVDTGKIYLPELGMACVVNMEKYRNSADVNTVTGEDTAWHRAVVTELGVRGRVRVQLVDSGSHEFVHWTSLRAIHAKFTKLRALATECHLAGVTPLNKKWSPASVALLKKYQNHVLEMHVEESRNRGSVGVTLFDKSDEENDVCINKEMIKYKFAITFGMFDFAKNNELKDQAYIYKTPLDEPKKTKSKPDKITILQRNSPNKIKEEDLAAKDKGPLRLEAKVLQYISPSLIYVSLVHQQKSFNEMFQNMQKYYSENDTKPNGNWLVGEKCCTICLESQTWRRATILELEEGNAKVFYSDFATVETLPTSSLRELAPEFISTGIAAIKCHLCGIQPAIGVEWPSLTKEFLKELLDAYPRIFITKLGNFKNKSMPVEIWVYHTIQGGALEPDKCEWRCLNKKIIEQGLAIPIKEEQAENIEEKEEGAEGDDETLCFLNVTGSVHEWLQLEPMPTRPLPEPEDTGSPADNEDHNEPDNHDFKTSNSIFVSEWLPPEPLQAKEFTAMTTFIDNDGVIFLHDIEQQSTLDLICISLNSRYKEPDQKAKYAKWTVGEPCIALYHYDNKFYRGRVVEVNQATSVCLIHYIDYGNDEVCSFTNMRKSIALHQIPTQAHKCVLNGIQPVGKQWERQTLDYIHRLIVEKHCYVIVKGNTVDGITPVDMKYDKLWINDNLVDFELATYTDGSKAMVRRYAPTAVAVVDRPRHRDEPFTQDVAVDSDSGPDYIVEDENKSTISTNDSFDFTSLKGKDWNTIVAEEESTFTGKFMEFPKYSEEEFKCNITLLNDLKVLPLSVVHDDETTQMYDEMFHEIQMESENMPPLNGIYKNKACIALFDEDGQWYRAVILEYSQVKNRLRVRYVDYGNIEVISLADAREIDEEWVKMAPLCVPAKLHGVDVNPGLEVKFVLKEYSELFSNKGPFYAKVINNDEDTPSVELRNSDGELVYQKLIENGVFTE